MELLAEFVATLLAQTISSLFLSPNPVDYFLRVEGDYDAVEFLDTSGKMISCVNYYSSKSPISLDDIKDGPYFVRAKKKGRVLLTKVIIARP